MAARVESRPANPRKALKALEVLSRALRHAVKHPTFDTKGRLVFQVRAVGRGRARARQGDPVSRPLGNLLCPKLLDGCWDQKAMVEAITLVPRLARHLYL